MTKHLYFWALGVSGVIIFFEYFLLGDNSYTRLADHQDTFLSRGISYAHSEIPGWMPAVQFGISSDVVAYRPFSLSNWLFQLAPSTYTPLFLLLGGILASAWGLRKLLSSYGVPATASLLAIIYFWICLARYDLYWYVIALSFLPFVLWLIDDRTKRQSNLLKAAGAGLLFVATNYLALTSPYLIGFVLAYVVLVGLGRAPGEQKKLGASTLAFLAVVVLGSLPSYLALRMQIEHSARTEGIYYEYGVLGAIDLIQQINLYSLPALLIVLWLAGMAIFTSRFSPVTRIHAGGLALVFVGAYLSQFYGFIAPLLADEWGVQIDVPLQRFWLVLPLATVISLPILLTKIEDLPAQAGRTGVQPVRLGVAVMLLIVIAVAPQFLETKKSHLEGWWNTANLSWAKSDSWQQLQAYRKDYRLAIITSRGDGLLPGHAQIAGFFTAGGDETASRYFKSFWMAADRSISRVPAHSHYFGWNNSDRFRAEPLEELLNLDLLAKAGVKFVVSSFPLHGDEIVLLNPQPQGEQAENQHSGESLVGGGRISQHLDMLSGAKPLWLYEVPNAKPRLWFASSFEQDPAKFDDCTAKLGCVFVNDDKALTIENSKATPTMTFDPIERGWEAEIFENTSGLLVLNETWSPGWEAKIDGVRVPILRVNENFQALVVEPGSRTATLQYNRYPTSDAPSPNKG